MWVCDIGNESVYIRDQGLSHLQSLADSRLASGRKCLAYFRMSPKTEIRFPQKQGLPEGIRTKYNEIEMERPHLCAKKGKILLLTTI